MSQVDTHSRTTTKSFNVLVGFVFVSSLSTNQSKVTFPLHQMSHWPAMNLARERSFTGEETLLFISPANSHSSDTHTLPAHARSGRTCNGANARGSAHPKRSTHAWRCANYPLQAKNRALPRAFARLRTKPAQYDAHTLPAYARSGRTCNGANDRGSARPKRSTQERLCIALAQT